jgi:hypothetical protein
MGDIFDDISDGLFTGPHIPQTPKKKPEKGLPWNAKTIDGKMYVPLEQVVELLKQNDVLPAVRRGLEKHLS